MTETSAGLDARLRAELGMPFLPTAEIAAIVTFYAIVIPTMVVEIECLRYALEPDAPSAGSASGVRAP